MIQPPSDKDAIVNRIVFSSCFCVGSLLVAAAWCQEGRAAGTRYQALKCPQPQQSSAWGIWQRDGANREVAPYLSSLVNGEPGTGVISSPPFEITVDTITFTVCGHDGQAGGQGKNFVALVDGRKGDVLAKTPPPSNDALQQRSWDVRDWKGRAVRIEMHDSDNGGAFAWMGVGQIDAGSALNVDFRQGMPEGWTQSRREVAVQEEQIPGGIPFLRNAAQYSVIPAGGAIEIPCGFTGSRAFLLGCTVSLGQPQQIYGGVELHYRSGQVDIIPLMVGYTLDLQGKMLSPAASIHLHPTADPFDYYLPLALRAEPLDMMRLVANPARGPIPRISAITIETDAGSEQLTPLSAAPLLVEEQQWIAGHLVSADTLTSQPILDQIRAAHRLPQPPISPVRFEKIVLDTVFRSEGVAVADFTGDGRVDIAAGSQLFVGPDWKTHGLLGEPRSFPVKGYSDAFLCFDEDVNRDGARDLIVVGFPGQQTHWLENPGSASAVWKQHLAVEHTGNESPQFVDVDGDGRRELLFMSDKGCAVARPHDDVTAPWAIQLIAGPGDPAVGHGLGVGDVNDDGLCDILIPGGWWQGAGRSTRESWEFHAAPFYGEAQLCVADFDGDGDDDVLGSSAHGYGIRWTERTADGWEQHVIDDTDSQTHALHLADINGDGSLDFVTGKRFWAHNGHDPGSYERVVLCWYELQRADGKPRWVKHEIDGNSGVGLHFQIVDLDGDGRLDIVTSNKKGVHVFRQTSS